MEVILSVHQMNLATLTLTHSDYSYRAISPITEEEYDTSDSTDESEGVLPESDSLHPTTFSLGLQPASTSTVEQCGHSQTISSLR